MEDRIKVIQEHYKNGAKIKNTFRALREYFGRNNRPNETTIGRLVRKFEASGLMKILVNIKSSLCIPKK